MIQPFHWRSRNRTARRRFRQMFGTSERFVLMLCDPCTWFVTPVSSVTLPVTSWRVTNGRIPRGPRFGNSFGSVKTARKGFRFPFETILSEGVVEINNFKFSMRFLTSVCKAWVRLNTSHLLLLILRQSWDDIVSALSLSEIFLEFFDWSVRLMLTFTLPRASAYTWICSSAFRSMLLPLRPTEDTLNWSETLLASSLRSVENRSWKQTNKLDPA